MMKYLSSILLLDRLSLAVSTELVSNPEHCFNTRP